MKYNAILCLLLLTVMFIYSKKKQIYHVNIDNNVDNHLLEICLFARVGNQRASHILYMQPHSRRTLELPFCCTEIKAHAWLSTQKASKVLDPLETISVYINKNNQGSFEITNN